MKRSNTMPIGDAINAFLRQEGLETPLNEHRLINSWNDVVGEAISQYTNPTHIKGETLYVKVKSPAVRERLTYSREKLIKLLNAKVKATVINNIIFY